MCMQVPLKGARVYVQVHRVFARLWSESRALQCVCKALERTQSAPVCLQGLGAYAEPSCVFARLWSVRRALVAAQVDEKRVIVFVNSKRACDIVYKQLDTLGYRCTVLHSGKTQACLHCLAPVHLGSS